MVEATAEQEKNDLWLSCMFDVHLEMGDRFEHRILIRKAPDALCIGVLHGNDRHELLTGTSLAELGWAVQFNKDNFSLHGTNGQEKGEDKKILEDGSLFTILVDLYLGFIEISLDGEVCARWSDVMPREYPLVFGASFLGGSGQAESIEPESYQLPEAGPLLFPEWNWLDARGSLAEVQTLLETYEAPCADNIDYRVPNVKICLMGFPGAGKSSFINTIYSAIQGKICRIVNQGVCPRGGSVTKVLSTYAPLEYSSRQDKKYTPIHIEDTAGKYRETFEYGQCRMLLCGQISDGTNFQKGSSMAGSGPSEVGLQAHVVVIVFPVTQLDNDEAIREMKEVINTTRLSNLEVPVIILLTMIDKALPFFKYLSKNPQEALFVPEVSKLVQLAVMKLGIPPVNILVQYNYHSEHSTSPGIDLLTLMNLKEILETATDYLSGPVFARRVSDQAKAQARADAQAGDHLSTAYAANGRNQASYSLSHPLVYPIAQRL